MSNILKLTNVFKTFTQGDQDFNAVDDANMTISKGEFVSITGKSGSGKSTLLGLIGALDSPTSGIIEIDGQDVTKLNSRELTDYRRQKIGFVFQNYNLVPNLSALENVMLPMEFAGLSKKERLNRAEELLDDVGIEDDMQLRRPNKMSGGEQQRVSVARALANKPKVILADEPTGNLDSENGKKVFELLHGLTRNHDTTVLVVTHDLDISGKTDRTFNIIDGKIKNMSSV
jgi:putative ABC transport system ATP-binding protein